MGVQLGGLVEARKVAIKDLAGRSIAFDGHNILNPSIQRRVA